MSVPDGVNAFMRVKTLHMISGSVSSSVSCTLRVATRSESNNVCALVSEITSFHIKTFYAPAIFTLRDKTRDRG